MAKAQNSRSCSYIFPIQESLPVSKNGLVLVVAKCLLIKRGWGKIGGESGGDIRAGVYTFVIPLPVRVVAGILLGTAKSGRSPSRVTPGQDPGR